MANPNHLRQPRPYTNRAEIGIGRAATQEWVGELAKTFASKAPEGVRLRLRRTPAVNYVSAEELKALYGDVDPSRLTKGIEALVGGLVSEHQLGILPVGVSKKNKNVFRRKGLPRLQMSIYDVPDATDLHPSGYLIRDEKTAVRESLGLVCKPPSDLPRTPIHILKIGYIIDNYDLLSSDVTKELLLTLSDNPVLQPVGPISL